MKLLFKFILPALIIFFLSVNLVSARSGCCSHHGGVCGCGCCDGSALSNTCAPYYPECSGPVYVSTPTIKPIVYTPAPTEVPTVEPIIMPTPILTPQVAGISTHIPTPTASISPTSTPKALTAGETVSGLSLMAVFLGLPTLFIIKNIRKRHTPTE